LPGTVHQLTSTFILVVSWLLVVLAWPGLECLIAVPAASAAELLSRHMPLVCPPRWFAMMFAQPCPCLALFVLSVVTSAQVGRLGAAWGNPGPGAPGVPSCTPDVLVTPCRPWSAPTRPDACRPGRRHAPGRNRPMSAHQNTSRTAHWVVKPGVGLGGVALPGPWGPGVAGAPEDNA